MAINNNGVQNVGGGGSLDELFKNDSSMEINDPFVRGNPETRSGSISLDTIGVSGSMRKAPIPPDNSVPTPAEKVADNTSSIADSMERNRKGQVSLAAANFFVDVMNANSRFKSIKGQANTNIFLAHQSAADALSRGRQRSFQLEEQGRTAAESAAVGLAAQGQDVQGAGVSRVEGSLEIAGIYNGMIAEINASREALGFEQEITQYQSQIESAELQRDMDILSSGLNLGANFAFL